MSESKPAVITAEIAQELCTRIASGRSVRDVCDDEDMPERSKVYRLLAVDDGFANQYARAMDARAYALAEELFEIADDGSNDWMRRNGKDGETAWQENGEAIRRSALRVDVRKWALARMAPKRYGDKVTVSGPGDNGEHVVKIEADEAFARLASRLASPAPGTAGGSDGAA
jgi:hypothetical protein